MRILSGLSFVYSKSVTIMTNQFMIQRQSESPAWSSWKIENSSEFRVDTNVKYPTHLSYGFVRALRWRQTCQESIESNDP